VVVRIVAFFLWLLPACTVEQTVLASEPSRLCKSGLETPSGEPLATGDDCVDRCLASTVDAEAELDSLALVLTPQCVLLAEDLGVPDTWSEQPTAVDAMLEACSRAADVVRESGTALLCSSEPTGSGDACTFDSSCDTSSGSSSALQATAVLLETRLPGVLSACCQRSDAQERLGDVLDRCTACGADPSVQTCVQGALSRASALTLIMLSIAESCRSFTNAG
jgi:hypothetical protein